MTRDELIDRVWFASKRSTTTTFPPDEVVELKRMPRYGAKGQRLPKDANPGVLREGVPPDPDSLPRLDRVSIDFSHLQIVTPPNEWQPDDPIGKPRLAGDATLILDRPVSSRFANLEIHSAKPESQGPRPSGAGWEAQAALLVIASYECTWEGLHVQDPYGDGVEFLGVRDPGAFATRTIPNVRPILDSYTSSGVGRNVITCHAVTGLRLTGRHLHRWFRNERVHWEVRYKGDGPWVHEQSIRHEETPDSVWESMKAMQRAGRVPA